LQAASHERLKEMLNEQKTTFSINHWRITNVYILIFFKFDFNNEMLTMLSTELLFMILIVLYMGICLITFSYRKRYRNALESSFFITILILTGLPVGAITLLNILAYF